MCSIWIGLNMYLNFMNRISESQIRGIYNIKLKVGKEHHLILSEAN